MENFTDQDEIDAWISEKVGMGSKEHPHRLHSSNWQLSEYWYEHHKGINNETTRKTSEMLERKATDTAAACASLGLEDGGKKKVTAEQRNKAWVGKITHLMQRFTKALMNADCKLPVVKRCVDAVTFGRLRDGVHAARLKKDEFLDELEDMKAADHASEDLTQSLAGLHSRISDAMEVVAEAFKSHIPAAVPSTPAVMKEEAEAQPPSGTEA